MGFEPDIVVTGPEGTEIALVVEAKTKLYDFDATERQLKEYMVGMRCPVGLLVTPERLWVYRDQYISASDDSITKVGEFDLTNVLKFDEAGVRRKDLAFEVLVQSWLEGLSTESGLRQLAPELRAAAQTYIVPAISQGGIRAGHPRYSLSA